MTQPIYGVDLVTFYHPGFWGVETDAEMLAWCAGHPVEMWEKMLDALSSAGVDGIEVTFPPLDHHSATAAFGSPEKVREALDGRGMRVISGFVDGTSWHERTADEIVAELADYTAFLSATGGTVLVVGSPMVAPRAVPYTADERQDILRRFAAACEAIGAALAPTGIRLAVHTESHSITVTADDITELMLTTDPGLVGLCPDSAHLTLSGTDPVAIAEKFADRVLVSHWKDASGPMPADLVVAPDEDVHAVHRRYMRSLGTGAVDWAGWARAMSTAPTAAVRLLELDATPDPIGELQAARAFAEQLGTD
ncbi:sugar phosphate isomerase/epimerase [Gryllotalpicola koreensis]|uniref:Sugar phosphate isomerase/epimerase n=1 Tax=Gryllotalpicola koreensis TaxID=993086 RepID=A0ABP7ZP85_9MICO